MKQIYPIVVRVMIIADKYINLVSQLYFKIFKSYHSLPDKLSIYDKHLQAQEQRLGLSWLGELLSKRVNISSFRADLAHSRLTAFSLVAFQKFPAKRSRFLSRRFGTIISRLFVPHYCFREVLLYNFSLLVTSSKHVS